MSVQIQTAPGLPKGRSYFDASSSRENSSKVDTTELDQWFDKFKKNPKYRSAENKAEVLEKSLTAYLTQWAEDKTELARLTQGETNEWYGAAKEWGYAAYKSQIDELKSPSGSNDESSSKRSTSDGETKRRSRALSKSRPGKTSQEKTKTDAMTSDPVNSRKTEGESPSDREARKRDEELKAKLEFRNRSESAWRGLTGAALDDSPASPPTTTEPRNVLGDFSGAVQTDSIKWDSQAFIRGANGPGRRWSGTVGTSQIPAAILSYMAKEGLPESQGGYEKDNRGNAASVRPSVAVRNQLDRQAIALLEGLYGDDATVPLAPCSMENWTAVVNKLNNSRPTMEGEGLVPIDQATDYPTLSKHLTYSAATAEGDGADWAQEFLAMTKDGKKFILTESQLKDLGDRSLLPPSRPLTVAEKMDRGLLQGFMSGGGRYAREAAKYAWIGPSRTSYDDLTKRKLPGVDNDTTDYTMFMETFQTKDGGAKTFLTLPAFNASDEFSMLNGKATGKGYITWDEIQDAAWRDEVTDAQVLTWVTQRRRFAEIGAELCLTEKEQKAWVSRLLTGPQTGKLSGCSGKPEDCTDWCGVHGKSAGRRKGHPKHEWSFDETDTTSEGRIAHANSDIKLNENHIEYGTKSERSAAVGSFGRRSGKKDEMTKAQATEDDTTCIRVQETVRDHQNAAKKLGLSLGEYESLPLNKDREKSQV